MKEPDSAKRTLIPTVGCALGLLVGGTIGAAVGTIFGREWIVVMLYIGGTLAGALGGSLLGYRWQSRQSP